MPFKKTLFKTYGKNTGGGGGLLIMYVQGKDPEYFDFFQIVIPSKYGVGSN